MDQISYNMSAAEVYSEAQQHPYIVVVSLVVFFFVLGSIVMCLRTTGTGVRAIGTGIYYITAPLHMPLRWAYKRL